MSTSTDYRRVVRIVAAEDVPRSQKNAHETVNVVAVLADADKGHNHGGTPMLKECVQLTAAQYNALTAVQQQQIDYVIASGGTVKGLRTIYVNGYSGPS